MSAMVLLAATAVSPAPCAPSLPPHVNDLVARLESPAWDERESAQRALERLDPSVAPHLKEIALKSPPETRARLQEVLLALEGGGWTPLAAPEEGVELSFFAPREYSYFEPETLMLKARNTSDLPKDLIVDAMILSHGDDRQVHDINEQSIRLAFKPAEPSQHFRLEPGQETIRNVLLRMTERGVIGPGNSFDFDHYSLPLKLSATVNGLSAKAEVWITRVNDQGDPAAVCRAQIALRRMLESAPGSYFYDELAHRATALLTVQKMPPDLAEKTLQTEADHFRNVSRRIYKGRKCIPQAHEAILNAFKDSPFTTRYLTGRIDRDAACRAWVRTEKASHPDILARLRQIAEQDASPARRFDAAHTLFVASGTREGRQVMSEAIAALLSGPGRPGRGPHTTELGQIIEACRDAAPDQDPILREIFEKILRAPPLLARDEQWLNEQWLVEYLPLAGKALLPLAREWIDDETVVDGGVRRCDLAAHLAFASRNQLVIDKGPGVLASLKQEPGCGPSYSWTWTRGAGSGSSNGSLDFWHKAPAKKKAPFIEKARRILEEEKSTPR